MKWLAIMNPHAGRREEKKLESLGEELKRTVDADWTWTNGAGTATEIVQKNPQYDGFVGVGGDGTICEVLEGLDPVVHSLGFLPAGSGNGLAHDLGLVDMERAVAALRRPRFSLLDFIVVRFRQNKVCHQRRMISTSALGYLAGAAAISNHPCKKWGNWIYALSAIIQSFYQEKFTARVRLDDRPWVERCLTSLVVQNTQYIGQFRLVPEAQVNDGIANILFGRMYPLGQLLEDLGTLTQTYFFDPSQHAQAHQIAIELPVPMTLMVDGDLYEHVDAVDYTVMTKKLRCCVGEDRTPAALEQMAASTSGNGRFSARQEKQQRAEDNGRKSYEPFQQRHGFVREPLTQTIGASQNDHDLIDDEVHGANDERAAPAKAVE